MRGPRSETIHLLVKISFKLRELKFGGNSQLLYQIQLRDVESVFLVEPAIFKGHFCSALERFIHRNVGEERKYIIRHQRVVFIDFHLMELVGKKEYVIDGVVIHKQGLQLLVQPLCKLVIVRSRGR